MRAILLAAVLLAGCAQAWEKEGTTPEERQFDADECSERANQGRVGSWLTEYGRDVVYGNCMQTRGYRRVN